MRSAGFTVLRGQGQQGQAGTGPPRQPFGKGAAQPTKVHVTDKLGDYVDFEEVK